jgi:hypothetical protein
VSGDELLGLMQIALGELSARICPAGDPNQDNTITVDEVLAAVNSASAGCPPK